MRKLLAGLEQIPNISFREKPGLHGFEFLDLQELLARDPAQSDHNPFLPHRLTFFAILIIEGGKVCHQLDFQTHTLEAGKCLVISKGQVHAFDEHAPYQGYLAIFTEQFLLSHLSHATHAKITRLYNYHVAPVSFFSPTENNHFIREIQEELQSSARNLTPDILAAILSVYLLRLEAASQLLSTASAKVEKAYEYFQPFRQLVEKEYVRSRNARFYAEQLGLSYKHLNEVCKRSTRRTAKAFIDDYVVLEIKRYLSATSLSAKEISYLCGFDEPTNFQKYFKKLTGQTPRSFREKHSQVTDLP